MKLKLVFLYILGFCCHKANAQDKQSDSNELINWPCFTQKAKFIYGEDSLIRFLKQNVKYPGLAVDSSYNSRTVLKFEIDSEDNLKNIKAVFSNAKGYGFEAEAIKVLMLTEGMWQSAMQDSQKVSSLYSIAVKSSPENTLASKDNIYNIWEVDVQPQITGYDSVQAYIASELKWPNQLGLVCGYFTISTSFVVDEYGYVSDITTESEVNVLKELLDTAEQFIIKTNRKWQPAQINNQRVKCKLTLPLIFEH